MAPAVLNIQTQIPYQIVQREIDINIINRFMLDGDDIDVIYTNLITTVSQQPAVSFLPMFGHYQFDRLYCDDDGSWPIISDK